MRKIIGVNYGSYSFNPIGKTITIAGITDILVLDNISVITNIKNNTIIYEKNVVGKECTISNNIITLTYDTSTMLYNDPLQIIVEIPSNMTAESKIDIIEYNFDLKQGQDLTIPMTYAMSDVPDSMLNVAIKMKIVEPGVNKNTIDTLTLTNNRINILGVNKFQVKFQSAVTNAYKIPSSVTTLNHSVFLIYPTRTIVMCEGVINFKHSNLAK